MRYVLLCTLQVLRLPEVMCCLLLCMLEVLQVPEVMYCVLLCLLEVLEIMCCVLLCMLEAADDDLSLPEVLEVMRRVLLCMLEAVEGVLYLPEVLEMLEVCDVCCSACWRLWRVSSVCWEVLGGAGDDAFCAALWCWLPMSNDQRSMVESHGIRLRTNCVKQSQCCKLSSGAYRPVEVIGETMRRKNGGANSRTRKNSKRKEIMTFRVKI